MFRWDSGRLFSRGDRKSVRCITDDKGWSRIGSGGSHRVAAVKTRSGGRVGTLDSVCGRSTAALGMVWRRREPRVQYNTGAFSQDVVTYYGWVWGRRQGYCAEADSKKMAAARVTCEDGGTSGGRVLVAR